MWGLLPHNEPKVGNECMPNRKCTHCLQSNIYSDSPSNPQADKWCLNCCEWIPPDDYKPAPYIPRIEESHASYDWHVDQYGYIVDDIDSKIESLVKLGQMLTVSTVAKQVQCSNGEARYSLERLVHVGIAEKIPYGPQNRWYGYIVKLNE